MNNFFYDGIKNGNKNGDREKSYIDYKFIYNENILMLIFEIRK